MRRFLVLIAVLALTVLTPAGAGARDVPRLEGQITDETGVLRSAESTITRALDELHRDHNVQLWVLFIRTTDATPVTTFADEVASVNSLGVNDVLLLVALDDRTDAMWVSDGLPEITDSDIDSIISTQLEPRLAAGDFGGAVVATATGLGQAAGPVVTPPSPTPTPTVTRAPTAAPTASGGTVTPGTTSGGGSILPIVIIIVVVVAVVWFVRSRRQTGTSGGGLVPGARTGSVRAPVSEKDLEKQANAGLIEIDEAVRDAGQELGFVEAQYGATQAAAFRTDLDQAASELKSAFVLRQALDDSIPEDAATRIRMLTEIVERCGRARELVARQASGVTALRALERSAPDLLTQLPPQIEAIEARMPAARASVAVLDAYAASLGQPVLGNVAEAEKRLDVARTSVEAGTQAVGAGDSGLAAGYVRQAQGALAETVALLDAIDRLGASLASARDQLPGEIAAAASDVEAARTAMAARGAALGSDAAGNLAQAESLLAAARVAAGGSRPDVLDAFQKATQANALADKVVAVAQADSDRAARRQVLVDGGLRSAGMSVERAMDFITTRRGGVGSEARTRIVEAERLLVIARSLAPSDPDGALRNAQRAQQLADDAYRLAAADFNRFDQPPPTPQPPIASTERGGGNVSGTGAILGGVLGGILSGGGGGWGGTRWGSPSPPPSGGHGGGGLGRTIGGGWGGLGGRSRGGRW